MKLILLLIAMAAAAAPFCGDTVIKKEVVKKRELCPGSRSVEAILKELRCVENTIVELTTAIVKVDAIQTVVDAPTPLPDVTVQTHNEGLIDKIKDFFGLGDKKDDDKPKCTSKEDQLKHCEAPTCQQGQIVGKATMVVKDDGCPFYSCPACKGEPCKPPPLCADVQCRPGQTKIFGEVWTDSRGCEHRKCPRCEGEPNCNHLICSALECREGEKPEYVVVGEGECQQSCPIRCIPKNPGAKECPRLPHKRCLIPQCGEDEHLYPGKMIKPQSTGCEEYQCPFCFPKSCRVGECLIPPQCKNGQTRIEGFYQAPEKAGDCPRSFCQWCEGEEVVLTATRTPAPTATP